MELLKIKVINHLSLTMKKPILIFHKDKIISIIEIIIQLFNSYKIRKIVKIN
jgi:hypothetical protein